jgi:PAS domain S-box-containing protein
MPSSRHAVEPGLFTDGVPDGVSGNPWEAVAELRTLVSLTAEVANALTRSSSLREGLQLCANALVQGLDAAFARIWTLNEKENVLELQASAGFSTHLDGPHSRVPVGQLKIGLIAQECKAHLTDNAIGDPLIGDQEWARREGMVAFAGYPLLAAGRVVGVMALFSRQAHTPMTLHAMQTVADSIAHGIAHWRTVEALGMSEERFDLAIRGTAEGIWDWNVLANEVYLAPRFKELLGYEDHELESSYAMWEERLHPEDRARVLSDLRQHLVQRRPFRVDYRLRTKSGDYRWFHARGQALWNDDGRAVRMLGSLSDITGRKLNEERMAAVHELTQILAEANESTEALPKLLTTLCEHLNWEVGAFWVRDRKDDVLRLAAFSHLPNVSVPALAGMSRQCSIPRGIGLPGRTWAAERLEWIEDMARDASLPRSAAARQDNVHGAVAFPVLVRGEVYGVMEFFSRFMLKPDAELLVVLEDISLDISRCIDLQLQRETIRGHRNELAISHQIQQRRGVLLKEMHHRVKNNLQLICSLLYLQSLQVTDGATLSVLRESENRVRSIALIHDKLFSSEQLEKIDFSDYLRDLIAQMVRAYRPRQEGIAVHTTLDPVWIGVETAFACGLIVNELVSNVLKHAFPEPTTGDLWIELHRYGDNRFILTVRDNGIGLPKEFDWHRSSSLGLKLVSDLTKQIGGRMEVNGVGATTFELTFSELHYKERG